MTDTTKRRFEVEVTWTYRVTVEASSDEDARERALEAAIERNVDGGAPDSEDVEIVDGPEQDDD